jgi:hypothetical protein
MNFLGLTVKQGNRHGLVLDFDPLTSEYTVEWDNAGGVRRVTKASRENIYLDSDLPAWPELAIFRKENNSDSLVWFKEYGWDIVSAVTDDDLNDPYLTLQRDDLSLMDHPAMGLSGEEMPPPTEKPDNPMAEGVGSYVTGPFPQRVPRDERGGYDAPSPDQIDDSFPSFRSSNDDVDLTTCPSCGGRMDDDSLDHGGDAECKSCGHKQPVVMATFETGVGGMGYGDQNRGEGDTVGTKEEDDAHKDSPERLLDAGPGGVDTDDIMTKLLKLLGIDREKVGGWKREASFDYGLAEKIAARKPKMCPFHADLTDFALELGDPSSAVNALSRHMYGPSSCKGAWNQDPNKGGHKCRFKPQFLKQDYWDQKEAEAEAKKLEREQQQALQPVVPEVPENQETAVGSPLLDMVQVEEEPVHSFESIDDIAAPVIQDIPPVDALESPADYNPDPVYEESNELAMVARVAAFDSDGDELQEGTEYEVFGPGDMNPDIARLDSQEPNADGDVVYNFSKDSTIGGAPVQFPVRKSQIGTEIIIRKHEHTPNAHGEVAEEEHTNSVPGDMNMGVTDLSRNASVDGDPLGWLKEGGADYSPREQREFVNEPGEARNLDKLDLSGTHYEDEFLWS